MNTAIAWLKTHLNYEFQDAALFEQALTHRSARSKNNERLEFLGDAILDFVMSEVIYEARPDAAEGDLSRLRSSLVRDRTLGELAVEIELGPYLILGSGELKSGGHRRESILADAMEALFGAIYLDGGFEAARNAILFAYERRMQDLPNAADLRDAKTKLQELLQSRKLALPRYDLVSELGADHKKRFVVACHVDEKKVTTEGESSSRRGAEQKAARMMLEKLGEFFG